ncbi:MAG: OmpP1/FadL family transporter, partial [Gammaproteobacteria bacterium]
GSDLGTLFFNPAGMSELFDNGERSRSSVGMHVIIPRSDLTDAGSTAITPGTGGMTLPSGGSNSSDPSDPTPVLNAYYARRLSGDGLSFGIRLNSPFGLSADFDRGWFGRYDSTEAELLTIDIGAVVAYEVNDRLTIGGGLDFQYADSELATAIPDPLTPGGPVPETDARFRAEGDDWEVGFNVGLMISAGDSTRIGLHYRSAISHDISGSATTSGLTGPLAPYNGTVGASTSLDLPAIIAVGFAHERPGSAFTFYGDYTAYGWEDLDTTRIEFADGSPPVERRPNFRNSYTAALGLDYRSSDKFTFRAGIKHDRSPTRDGYRDTTFADDDRFWISIGGTWQRSETFAIDFAFVHVLVDDTQVDITRSFFEGTPLASSTRTLGTVDSTVNTLAVGFRWTL